MKKFIVTIVVLMVIFGMRAQSYSTPNIVGKNHTIGSSVLKGNREIQIYLPPTYEGSGEHYPVVYLLDGQRFFLYSVSLSQTFQQFKLSPEFIIVGIYQTYPKRFQELNEGKENFLEFLENELMPYVNTHFRTKGEDLLFGWEYGGSFVFHTFLNGSHHFDAYIAASPYPIFDAIDEFDPTACGEVQLYFATSPDEYEVRHGTEKLNQKLTDGHVKGLDWKYFEFDLEEHRSTGYPTLYHGLRNYFKYYQEFETNSLKNFLAEGGMDHARNHAKERARRYGFSSELSLWSKYTIIRSAWRANDFYYFESLFNALGKDQFMNELLKGNMDHAVSTMADFYKRNHKYNDAVRLYELLLSKHPNSGKLIKKVEKARDILKSKNHE
ncbi:alpha/beta hydrolase [Flagellimonas sediminis]|uniref:Esterase n=1 Tax=Flagellimonas sediminis TaxID=2696468 RepID=A0A6I5KNF4_9FLAO|nr:alpha/beta hydrolase-fold protein [Allomuricauda sediminis]NDV42404.1 hypothetical protein [Allomuricauda sediminis]